MNLMDIEHNYNIIRIEDSPWSWCYSARELESLLNSVCRGNKLLRCMVELRGFLDAVPYDGNLLDLSYMGGNALLIFDKTVLEFDIRVEGLIGYRIVKPWNVHIHPVYDSIPQDYITNPIYFCDVKSDLATDYEGRTVCDVKIDTTNTWGFSARGFNSEKASAAAAAHDLPDKIHFILNNGMDFCLIADSLEYYMIKVNGVE